MASELARQLNALRSAASGGSGSNSLGVQSRKPGRESLLYEPRQAAELTTQVRRSLSFSGYLYSLICVSLCVIECFLQALDCMVTDALSPYNRVSFFVPSPAIPPCSSRFLAHTYHALLTHSLHSVVLYLSYVLYALFERIFTMRQSMAF